MTWTPVPTACVRDAWLTLGNYAPVHLNNPGAGYFCTELDLGYPSVRAVVNNRPDQHGIDDRTAFWGERAVSFAITALAGAGAQVDAVAGLFAPFMNPAVRPVLHYVLDRPGAAERVLTLRPAGFTGPIVGNNQRDLHLSFVAADPLPLDPTWHNVIAWSGAGVAAGRTYPLTFARTYPSGGTGSTYAVIVTNGDVPVAPLLYIYGPITRPAVTIYNTDNSGTFTVMFLASFIIQAGHYVVVDTARKTAYVDNNPAQPVVGSIDWTSTQWPVVTPAPNTGRLSLSGSSTSAITQVVAWWQDVFLT